MASLLGKVFDRLTLLTLRVAFRELRATRKTLEVWIDTYRLVHQLPPLYSAPAPVPEEETLEQRRVRLINPGDWQTVAQIQELCDENRVPYDLSTDLEQLALDMGWITPTGEFVTLPQSAKTAGRY